MVKKIGDKKVDKLSDAKSVKQTESVQQVQSIKSVSGVGGVEKVGAVSGKRRPTTLMSIADRENYLRMISEEADKMLSAGVLSKSQASIVVEAVKTAVDAALVDDDNEKKPKKKE